MINKTELVKILREGAGVDSPSSYIHAHREMDLEELPDDIPEGVLQGRREAIEAHIKKYISRLRTQLPGCTGSCTTYGCPDLIVTRCWEGFKRDM